MVAVLSLPSLPDLTPERAEHWVAVALAEGRALRQYDEHLYPTADAPEAARAAEDLHAAWQQWADRAADLLRRADPLVAAGSHVAGVHDLDYELARARAMLKLSPRTMMERSGQVARGAVMTGEEVRRALRVADRG